MTRETFEALDTLREAIGILADLIPQDSFERRQARQSLDRKLNDLRHFMQQCHIEAEEA